MINGISVVIITRNAAATLATTLAALSDFEEVVIYDNDSDDETHTIAARFSNVRLHIGHFDGFGTTKNRAVAQATHNWILSLDADEHPSAELLDTLSRWHSQNGDQQHAVGMILRENYLLGKKVVYGGWGKDYLVRLFNRKHHQFNHNPVHESVALNNDSKSHTLKGVIVHNAVSDIGQFLVKINRYSSLRAQSMADKGKRLHPILIVLKTKFAFFRSYFLQLGLLAGWRGLLIAYCAATGVFFKYLKAYSLHTENKHIPPEKPTKESQD